MGEVDYIVVVQCQIARQRCSGFGCEKAFTRRAGGFADYPADRLVRTLYTTCGGCCGKATGRVLAHLKKQAARDGVAPERIVVHLASCITKDNYHSPPCPHLAYIRQLVQRLGLTCREDTVLSAKAQQRRAGGAYRRSGEH